MRESLPKQELQKIAGEITKDIDIPQLPQIEEIAWAFPIIGNFLHRPWNEKENGEFCNSQEFNAWETLLLFRNYRLAIEAALEGKMYEGWDENGHMMYPFNHSGFKDPIHLCDVTHLSKMFGDILNLKNIKGTSYDPKNYPKPIQSIQDELSKGYFWTNIPKGLIQKVEENDKLGWYSKNNEEDTLKYLISTRDLLRLGVPYLREIAEKSNKADEWPQMIRTDSSGLNVNDYFQIVLFNPKNGSASLNHGVCSGAKGDKLKLEYLNYNNRSESMTQEYSSEKLANAIMWKLVMLK